MTNYKSKLKHITTFIFDYDGVLSDGTVVLQTNGDALRTANVRDGFALNLAVRLGYRVVIISGGNSESMRRRFESLNIKDFFLGVPNKLEVFEKFILEYNIPLESVLYMGDDLPDFKSMQKAGLPCCPSDAAPEIKSISAYISGLPGGKGCVRDVIEQTLKIQGKWMTDEGFTW
jgi:3-deoxy-D-manno-octulosonate 8-phosphate phosphatase (KDO 8-P phosphatase)